MEEKRFAGTATHMSRNAQVPARVVGCGIRVSGRFGALRLPVSGLLAPGYLSSPDSVGDKDHWTTNLRPVAL